MKKTDIEILRTSVLPSTSLQKSIIKKVSLEHEELDPNGYFWDLNILYHTGKKVHKKKVRLNYLDFFTSFTRQVQKVVERDLSDVDFSSFFVHEEEEMWRPLIITNKRKDAESQKLVELFSERFIISQYGNIKSVDGFENVVGEIYWHKNDFDFHVQIKTLDGNEMISKNQGIRSLIRNAFGTEYSDEVKNIITAVRAQYGKAPQAR